MPTSTATLDSHATPRRRPTDQPFTLTDVTGSIGFSDALPRNVSAEATDAIVRLTLVRVLGTACIDRRLRIDLGNGHVLACQLEPRA